MSGKEPDPRFGEFFAENRDHWEEILQQNSLTDAVYRAEEFLAGETALLPIEEEEVGEVAGKTLLDLQCFAGVRTLSWARKGATVTGVDISAEAIEIARSLAAETGLENQATFIEANVYDLPAVHDGQYDVVFTSFGVLCWLPDLERWAEVVGEYLKPGGTFYLAEHHPIADVLSFDFDRDGASIDIETSYFSTETPATGNGPPYKWTHSLGETLSSLLDAGIELRFVHEHPFSPLERFPGMIQDENRYWRFEQDIDLPLMVTVKGKMKKGSEFDQ